MYSNIVQFFLAEIGHSLQIFYGIFYKKSPRETLKTCQVMSKVSKYVYLTAVTTSRFRTRYPLGEMKKSSRNKNSFFTENPFSEKDKFTWMHATVTIASFYSSLYVLKRGFLQKISNSYRQG